MSTTTPSPHKISSKNALTEADIDVLIGFLETLSDTFDTISLEGLDGVAAALAVMLRPVSIDEVWPLLVQDGTEQLVKDVLPAADFRQMCDLIQRRVNHSERLLSLSDISDLGDPRAYHPWVVDFALAAQSDAALAAELAAGELPELGFEWALGFISTVEHFALDWRLEDELLDDELNPMISPFYALALPRDEWPDDIKVADVGGDTREAWFAQAIWGCYELWEYWRHHAPRPKGITVTKTAEPGRNDPCHCGSGKKYKTCHG
jgi:uncharacterized protein